MVEGIRLKVCGLTSLVDAEFADRCGSDWLGFILYPKSPRHVPLAAFAAMRARLPERKRVAVTVEPDPVDLARYSAEGFDAFQVHFRPETPISVIAGWAEAVGPARLWLAPKLPPASDVPSELLPFARHILLDTFHADKFGGTGRTSDWTKFSRHRRAHPDKTWILSGGLSPETIGPALKATGARFVDVNSGVESAPGVKDHTRLQALVGQLRRLASG